jgi:hypothetical protein
VLRDFRCQTVVVAAVGLAMLSLASPASASMASHRFDSTGTKKTTPKGVALTFSGGIAGIAGVATASAISRCGVITPNPTNRKFKEWVLDGSVTVNGTPFMISLQVGIPAQAGVPVTLPGGGAVPFGGPIPAVPYRGPARYSSQAPGRSAIVVQLVGDLSHEVPVTTVSNKVRNNQVVSSFVSATGTAIERWGGSTGSIALTTATSGSLDVTLGQAVINVTYPEPAFRNGTPSVPALQLQGTFNCK